MDEVFILANFGGPRDLGEVEEFLIALLTDQDVIRTPFPRFLHRYLFTRVAKKRTLKVAPDYARIGGKSPIFEDTEAIREAIEKKIGAPILTFHRYLPKTHKPFVEQIRSLADVSTLRIFPFFPQYSTATTGSIAHFFSRYLPKEAVRKMVWVRSYATHPAYIQCMQACIRDYLAKENLQEEDVLLLFSAHGIPKKFVKTGDPYQSECEATYEAVRSGFPEALSSLCYQSQFGKEEWIRPYTSDVCQEIGKISQGRQNVVVVPLSFTSDHIETLYEIEEQYLPPIRESGFRAFRCPALNRREDWLKAIAEIMQS
ncbi:MAG: ferrochelatase [Verrucomicrobia bacterium]|nr:ferrochelatase [Verrucomicrobiota bacterium]